MMSALQEILEKGYVDPELLAQLGEEQKQILFIKMREEQLRKWRIWEAELEKADSLSEMMPKNGRRVKWLDGKDGDVWVWVMGEHSDDISIEQILERESKEKARLLAEKEIMQTLRKAEDLPNILERNANEQALKSELARMDLKNGDIGAGQLEDRSGSHSPYDELVGPLPAAVLPNGIVQMGQPEQPVKQMVYSNMPANRQQQSISPLLIFPGSRRDSLAGQHIGTGKSGSPLPFAAQQDIYGNLMDGTRTDFGSPVPSLAQSTFSSSQPQVPVSARRSLPVHNRMFQLPSGFPTFANTNGIAANNTMAQKAAKPPPIPEKPASLLRRTADKNIAHQPIAASSSSTKTRELPAEKFAFNTIRSYIPELEVQKRQSKIFEQLREQREQLEREAEAEAQREQSAWEEQERRAKEAEESIRKIAQKAREQHRKCLRTSDALMPLFRDNQQNAGGKGRLSSVREALKGLQRPPKPSGRLAILQWFRDTEMGQWAGQPPKWFHGVISREQTERLLAGKPVGSFLVRVTERIFGYAVSYRTEAGITKNFLVERIAEGYQFMGTNQLVHPSLAELIAHHHSHPITTKGGELLRQPVGQQTQPPDYEELFRVNWC